MKMITMTTIIVLAVYISGVWAAYYQLLYWYDKNEEDSYEPQKHFMLSMLSWFVYPLYGVLWLINCKERE